MEAMTEGGATPPSRYAPGPGGGGPRGRAGAGTWPPDWAAAREVFTSCGSEVGTTGPSGGAVELENAGAHIITTALRRRCGPCRELERQGV